MQTPTPTFDLAADTEAMIVATPEQWATIKPELDAWEAANVELARAQAAVTALRRERETLTRKRASSDAIWECWKRMVAAFMAESAAYKAVTAARKLANVALTGMIRDVDRAAQPQGEA